MNINKTPYKIDVFIDYTWPWVRQTSYWLRDLKNELGEQLVINWRSFLLEQVNTKDKGDNWKAWEQPPDYISRGIWPLRGGIASNKINISNLQKSKLISKKYGKLKLLGSGDLKQKLDIEVNAISKSAKEKIEKLGGKVTLVK